MTAAKQGRLARELDTRVRYLRLTGLDGIALFAAMADRMPDFKALMDGAGPDGMDALAGRLPDLRNYATVLTGVTRGIQDGIIKAPR